MGERERKGHRQLHYFSGPLYVIAAYYATLRTGCSYDQPAPWTLLLPWRLLRGLLLALAFPTFSQAAKSEPTAVSAPGLLLVGAAAAAAPSTVEIATTDDADAKVASEDVVVVTGELAGWWGVIGEGELGLVEDEGTPPPDGSPEIVESAEDIAAACACPAIRLLLSRRAANKDWSCCHCRD